MRKAVCPECGSRCKGHIAKNGTVQVSCFACTYKGSAKQIHEKAKHKTF